MTSSSILGTSALGAFTGTLPAFSKISVITSKSSWYSLDCCCSLTSPNKEKISALADGELSEFETRRILNEIGHNPAYREFWRNIHLVKDLFDESEDFLHERDISKDLRSRLRTNLSEETNKDEKWFLKKQSYSFS